MCSKKLGWLTYRFWWWLPSHRRSIATWVWGWLVLHHRHQADALGLGVPYQPIASHWWELMLVPRSLPLQSKQSPWCRTQASTHQCAKLSLISSSKGGRRAPSKPWKQGWLPTMLLGFRFDMIGDPIIEQSLTFLHMNNRNTESSFRMLVSSVRSWHRFGEGSRRILEVTQVER